MRPNVAAATATVRHPAQQGFIQRFDKAHVHQGGIQCIGNRFGLLQQGAECQDGNLLALTQHTSTANRECLHGNVRRDSGADPAGITHCRRSSQLETCVQHLPTFVFIRWRHDGQVGDSAQEANIERPLVRRAIGTDDPGPVDGK